MINHDKYDELIPIYAIGALDGEELNEMEGHIKAGCPVCQEKLRGMENVINLIPYSQPSASPSPKVKQRLLERVSATKETEEKFYIPSLWQRLRPVLFGLGTAVATVLLIFLFVSNLELRDRLREKELEISSLEERIDIQNKNVKSFRNELAQSREQVANLKGELSRKNEIVAFLQNPNVVVINLVGLEPKLEAKGRILLDTRHKKAFFYALNLPQAPSGKTYQLWVIADGSPKSAGVFNVNRQGNSVVEIEALPEPTDIQKFAVTLEPEGGLPQPSGEMYLIGDV